MENRVLELSASKFIWKIPNVSKLVAEKHYSDIFLAGGCKWRVVIYPKGIDAQLALFLCSEDVAKLPFAKFKISVLNQLNDQNTKTKDEQHQFTKQHGWGFASFMPLWEFDDPKKGFLVDDTCFVKVEIQACGMMENSTNNDSLEVFDGSHESHTMENRLVELPPSTKFIWKIENFSKLGTDGHYSDTFFASGIKWRLRIFPKGNNLKYLSIFLYTEDFARLPFADYSIVLLNESNSNKAWRQYEQHQFCSQFGWGFTYFMPLSELNDPRNGYLVNDTCFVRVKISACCMKENSTDDDPIKVVSSKTEALAAPVKVTPIQEYNRIEVSERQPKRLKKLNGDYGDYFPAGMGQRKLRRCR